MAPIIENFQGFAPKFWKLRPTVVNQSRSKQSSTNPDRTQHMYRDCPSSSRRFLTEQRHHCYIVCLWHHQICDEAWMKTKQKKKIDKWWGESDKERELKTEMETGMHWQRRQQFQGGVREKALSCGLAELTMNLCRFIFSESSCSLKGGQIYMPLLGLQQRGPEDGISRLRGWDGGFFHRLRVHFH